MTGYLKFMKSLERSDALAEKASELATLLKSGREVRIGPTRTLGSIDIEEYALDYDVTESDACDNLALLHVERWLAWNRE